jgi:anti-sigma B factor antagonist
MRAVITVKAPEAFDVYTAGAVREEFADAIERDGASLVIADLERVTYIDNVGVGVLVGALRRARARDCTLVVVCTAEPVLRVFRILGLAKVFDIRDSAEELSEKENG